MPSVHHKAVDAVRRGQPAGAHHPPTDSPDEGVAATGPSASRLALGSVIGEQVRAALAGSRTSSGRPSASPTTAATPSARSRASPACQSGP